MFRTCLALTGGPTRPCVPRPPLGVDDVLIVRVRRASRVGPPKAFPVAAAPMQVRHASGDAPGCHFRATSARPSTRSAALRGTPGCIARVPSVTQSRPHHVAILVPAVMTFAQSCGPQRPSLLARRLARVRPIRGGASILMSSGCPWLPARRADRGDGPKEPSGPPLRVSERTADRYASSVATAAPSTWCRVRGKVWTSNRPALAARTEGPSAARNLPTRRARNKRSTHADS